MVENCLFAQPASMQGWQWECKVGNDVVAVLMSFLPTWQFFPSTDCYTEEAHKDNDRCKMIYLQRHFLTSHYLYHTLVCNSVDVSLAIATHTKTIYTPICPFKSFSFKISTRVGSSSCWVATRVVR